MKKPKLLAVWLQENFRMGGIEKNNSYEAIHFPSSLKAAGFDVEVLPWDGISDASLISAVERHQPEYLFVVWYRTGIQPQTIKYISETYGVKTICWNGDDEHQFDIKEPWATKNFAPFFDHVVSTFKGSKKDYARLGIKPIITTFGANEKVFKPRALKKTMDISFIGTGYEDRAKWLQEIKGDLPELRVAGGMWAQFPFLLPDEYPRAFNQTKVNLNYGWNRGHLQIKGRDFEVPMSGGFLLTTHNPDLAEYFVVGKEIETYKSNKELVEKAKYYASHDRAREKIAMAGYLRAIKDHTYTKRFKDIFKKI